MTAAELIQRAKSAGVTLSASDGEIRYKGPREAVAGLIPELRKHKAELLRMLTTTVEVEVPGRAACDMRVPAERASAFVQEATRRGLIVCYRLKDEHGRPLPGCGIEMPGPGQTAAQLRDRLRAEFGERLTEVSS